MAPRAVLVTILAYLAISGSTSPLDIAPQTLWKRSFASCPGGKQPSDDNSQGIKACSLPSFNCPSAGAQAAQIAGVKADPKCKLRLVYTSKI